jgi:hypothetical protein
MNEITTQLLQLYHDSRPVKFTNIYQGIPISCTGNILKVEEDRVTFNISRYQGLCLKLEGRTIIHSDFLTRKFQAETVQVDLKNETAVLTNFEPADFSIESRLHIRVETNKPINALLSNTIEVNVKVTEVSINGLALYIRRANYESKYFSKGKKANIEFDFISKSTGKKQQVHMEGIIRSVNMTRDLLFYRLGIETMPSYKNEMILREYIDNRQEEILAEIKRLTELDISSLVVGDLPRPDQT